MCCHKRQPGKGRYSMFISSAASGFRKWPVFQTQANSNDNDHPGGSTPVSVANALSNGSDALIRLERTGSA